MRGLWLEKGGCRFYCRYDMSKNNSDDLLSEKEQSFITDLNNLKNDINQLSLNRDQVDNLYTMFHQAQILFENWKLADESQKYLTETEFISEIAKIHSTLSQLSQKPEKVSQESEFLQLNPEVTQIFDTAIEDNSSKNIGNDILSEDSDLSIFLDEIDAELDAKIEKLKEKKERRAKILALQKKYREVDEAYQKQYDDINNQLEQAKFQKEEWQKIDRERQEFLFKEYCHQKYEYSKQMTKFEYLETIIPPEEYAYGYDTPIGYGYDSFLSYDYNSYNRDINALRASYQAVQNEFEYWNTQNNSSIDGYQYLEQKHNLKEVNNNHSYYSRMEHSDTTYSQETFSAVLQQNEDYLKQLHTDMFELQKRNSEYIEETKSLRSDIFNHYDSFCTSEIKSFPDYNELVASGMSGDDIQHYINQKQEEVTYYLSQLKNLYRDFDTITNLSQNNQSLYYQCVIERRYADNISRELLYGNAQKILQESKEGSLYEHKAPLESSQYVRDKKYIDDDIDRRQEAAKEERRAETKRNYISFQKRQQAFDNYSSTIVNGHVSYQNDVQRVFNVNRLHSLISNNDDIYSQYRAYKSSGTSPFEENNYQSISSFIPEGINSNNYLNGHLVSSQVQKKNPFDSSSHEIKSSAELSRYTKSVFQTSSVGDAPNKDNLPDRIDMTGKTFHSNGYAKLKDSKEKSNDNAKYKSRSENRSMATRISGYASRSAVIASGELARNFRERIESAFYHGDDTYGVMTAYQKGYSLYEYMSTAGTVLFGPILGNAAKTAFSNSLATQIATMALAEAKLDFADSSRESTLNERIRRQRDKNIQLKKEIRQLESKGTSLTARERQKLSELYRKKENGERIFSGLTKEKSQMTIDYRFDGRVQGRTLSEMIRNTKKSGNVLSSSILELESKGNALSQSERNKLLNLYNNRIASNQLLAELNGSRKNVYIGKGFSHRVDGSSLNDMLHNARQTRKALNKKIYQLTSEDSLSKTQTKKLIFLQQRKAEMDNIIKKLKESRYQAELKTKKAAKNARKSLSKNVSDLRKMELELFRDLSSISSFKLNSQIAKLNYLKRLNKISATDLIEFNRLKALKAIRMYRMNQMPKRFLMVGGVLYRSTGNLLRKGEEDSIQGLLAIFNFSTKPYVRYTVVASKRLVISASGFAGRMIIHSIPAKVVEKRVIIPTKKRVSETTEILKKRQKVIYSKAKRQISSKIPTGAKTKIDTVFRNTRYASSRINAFLNRTKEISSRATEIATAPIRVLQRSFKFIKGFLFKSVGGFIALVLFFNLIMEGVGSATSYITSFIVTDKINSSDGKIDLSEFSNAYEEVCNEFNDEIQALSSKVTGNGTFTITTTGNGNWDNFKEIMSMSAVYFNQDFDDMSAVKKYFKYLFNASHNYVCEETITTTVSGEGRDAVITKNTSVNVIVTVSGFPELFDIDKKGNADATVGQGELIGKFLITHYCTERYPHICNDLTAPTSEPCKTATGTIVTPGRTIAVDPSIIPYGTHVLIDGHEYIAEDCGGAIKQYHIDMAVDTHSEAMRKGTRQNVPVYAVSYEGESIIETGEWDGWTDDNKEWCMNIYEQDWDDIYTGLPSVNGGFVDNNGNPLDVPSVSGEGNQNTGIYDTWQQPFSGPCWIYAIGKQMARSGCLKPSLIDSTGQTFFQKAISIGMCRSDGYMYRYEDQSIAPGFHLYRSISCNYSLTKDPASKARVLSVLKKYYDAGYYIVLGIDRKPGGNKNGTDHFIAVKNVSDNGWTMSDPAAPSCDNFYNSWMYSIRTPSILQIDLYYADK